MRVAVVNVKGGVGKTTTAIYLAAAIAERHGTAILVDADPQASAAEWLEAQSVDGVQLVEAPSERLVRQAAALADGIPVVFDAPPGSERIVSAVIAEADSVVIPTRAAGVEISRVTTTQAMLPDSMPRGLVITSARPRTRAHVDTIDGWRAAGVDIWGVIPQRVDIAAGPTAPLSSDAVEWHHTILDTSGVLTT